RLGELINDGKDARRRYLENIPARCATRRQRVHSIKVPIRCLDHSSKGNAALCGAFHGVNHRQRSLRSHSKNDAAWVDAVTAKGSRAIEVTIAALNERAHWSGGPAVFIRGEVVENCKRSCRGDLENRAGCSRSRSSRDPVECSVRTLHER